MNADQFQIVPHWYDLLLLHSKQRVMAILLPLLSHVDQFRGNLYNE